jgi:hypothetical protein
MKSAAAIGVGIAAISVDVGAGVGTQRDAPGDIKPCRVMTAATATRAP